MYICITRNNNRKFNIQNLRFMTNLEKWMKVLEFACSLPQAQYLTREAVIEFVYKAMMNQFPEEKDSWDKCKSLSLMAAAK